MNYPFERLCLLISYLLISYNLLSSIWPPKSYYLIPSSFIILLSYLYLLPTIGIPLSPDIPHSVFISPSHPYMLPPSKLCCSLLFCYLSVSIMLITLFRWQFTSLFYLWCNIPLLILNTITFMLRFFMLPMSPRTWSTRALVHGTLYIINGIHSATLSM